MHHVTILFSLPGLGPDPVSTEVLPLTALEQSLAVLYRICGQHDILKRGLFLFAGVHASLVVVL